MLLKDLYKKISQPIASLKNKTSNYFGIGKPGLGQFGQEVKQIPQNIRQNIISPTNPQGFVQKVAMPVAKYTYQPIIKGGASIALSTIKKPELIPQTKFQKVLFGREPVKSVGERQKYDTETLKKLGISGTVAKPLGFTAGLAGLALDVSPVGFGKNITKKLATETTEQGIKKILGKQVSKYSDDVIKTIAKTKNERTIIQLLKNPTQAIVGATDALSKKTIKKELEKKFSKYKTIDDFVKGEKLEPARKQFIKEVTQKGTYQADEFGKYLIDLKTSQTIKQIAKTKNEKIIAQLLKNPTQAIVRTNKVSPLTQDISKAKQSGQSFDEWVKGQKAVKQKGVRKPLYHGTTEEARQTVQQNLQNKFDNLEQRLYGNTQAELKGGTKGMGQIAKITQPLQAKASAMAAKGMQSENTLIRSVAKGLRSLFGQFGETTEQGFQLAKFRGADDSTVQLANDVERYVTNILRGDKNKLSRVHSVLDPEISGLKISEKQLLNDEKKAVNFLREVSDYINDMSFAQGKISLKTWEKGVGGKYITRAYDEYDLPKELMESEAFRTSMGKLDLSQYKHRTDITNWKLDHKIDNPAYLVGKSLQKVYRNQKIAEYTNWVSKQGKMVSDDAKKGYTQLSESPIWADLSGKFVRDDVLEGIRGFYSNHKAVQGLLDALNWYDRLPARRILKATKTVFNPAVRLGNQIGNRIFALLGGINPFKFEHIIQTFAKQDLKSNGIITRFLRENGVLGSDFTRKELQSRLGGLEKTKIKEIYDYVGKTYGQADDHAKIAAFKYWIDSGKTKQEALRKVMAHFQNYNTVGFLYDIGAKIPVFGNAFVRFQGDLIRMVKNAGLENPLGLLGIIGAIYTAQKLSSIISGESKEDYQTRTNRVGVPKLLGTNIPMTIMLGDTEVNIARLFGLYSNTPIGGEGVVNKYMRQFPIQIPTSKREIGQAITSDPLTGGPIGVLSNVDFRGKSVRDLDENKYQPSVLTPTEQNINRLKYLSRTYNLPVGNDLINVFRATQGKGSIYGTQMSPEQAMGRLAGVKTQTFGEKEALEQRNKDLYYQQSGEEANNKKVNQIIKDQLSGKITSEIAQKRINNIQKNIQPQTQKEGIYQLDGQYHILINGNRKTFDTEREAQTAIDKKTFKQSDKNFQIIGDKVFRKNVDGYVSVISKDTYDNRLNDAKLSSLKSSKNYKEWLVVADKQFQNIQTQLEDPTLDELEKQILMNEAKTLATNYQKYQGYGGFTKPKSGRSKTEKAMVAKAEAQFALNTDRYERANDFNGYIESAKSQIAYYEELKKTARTDTEVIRLTNKQEDLITKVQKLVSQGGFKTQPKINVSNIIKVKKPPKFSTKLPKIKVPKKLKVKRPKKIAIR